VVVSACKQQQALLTLAGLLASITAAAKWQEQGLVSTACASCTAARPHSTGCYGVFETGMPRDVPSSWLFRSIAH